ncbi:MAG: MarR family winged helix-turn-helix transcriptional regulator [Fidelibacterota bacterium]
MDLSEQLRDLNSQLTAIIRRIASSHRLTFSQANILLSIPVDGILMSQLADKIGIEISTATRNLNKLENMGFVQRSKIHSDKRKVTLKVTNEGKEVIDKLEIDLDELSFSLQNLMSDEDKERLYPVIESINWNLTRIRAGNN